MWDEAWPGEDVESIAALYAPDAVFYSHPFRESQVPAEYVAWAFGDQRAAECRFGVPVVEGARAAVDWWGVITSIDGSVTTLAGTSLLRFDESGRVVEQRDVWAEHEGRVELTHWARVPDKRRALLLLAARVTSSAVHSDEPDVPGVLS